MAGSKPTPPTKFGIILFDGFQALDVFGPLDVLNMLSRDITLEQYIITTTLNPVSTRINAVKRSIGQSIVPTHTLDNAPEDIEVLFVPGGKGVRETTLMDPIVAFIKTRFPKVRYLLTVCTGSVLAARAGVLEGRRATSNKLSFDWVIKHGDNVDWVRKARWVVDGNVWTSSGISAGIDMMYAFVADQYGEKIAERIANDAEYIRNKDADADPWAR